jgi:hypothetical protein
LPHGRTGNHSDVGDVPQKGPQPNARLVGRNR